jgi:hypothetical protein
MKSVSQSLHMTVTMQKHCELLLICILLSVFTLLASPSHCIQTNLQDLPCLLQNRYWAGGNPSWGVKRPQCDTVYSLPSSAEVKNGWRYTSSPPYVFMPWSLIKQRDSFTFIVT